MIAKIDLLSVQTGIAYAFYGEDGAFISIDSSGVTHVSDGIYIIDFTPPEDASLMIVTSDDYDLRVPVDLDEILQISKIRSDVGSIKSKTDNLNDISTSDIRTELSTELARIDAAISSRSTYGGGDTAGTTTLLDRLTSGRAGNLDKLAVSGTIAHSDDAATYKADVSGLATSSALDAAEDSILGAIGDIDGGNAPSAGEIADAVWNEAMSGHLDSGTAGAALAAAGSSGDPWETSLPGAYGPGTAGSIVGSRIDAAVSTRSSHGAADVWSVGTRTLTGFGSLVSDIASAVWGAGARTLTAIADSSGVTTLLGRLTAGRAGYLDKLNVSGTLAHSDAAATYRADVSGLATSSALDSAKDSILEEIGEIEPGVDVPALSGVVGQLLSDALDT